MDEKKYDLFTNMVQNQDFSYDDLVSAGLNSSNTELKDKDTYKRSEKVQELFKNDSGQFDEVKFNNFYNTASIFYNQMATADYNASVEKAAVYHRDNIFAPVEQRKEGPDFTTYKTINPYRSTSGLTELGKVQESPFSISELAQNRKVLLNPVEAEKDPNKAQWGDAPNDNFLGYFFDTLVLATYDKDTEEIDPTTGKSTIHQKGEPKLSPEGDFYYERLDGRDPYGRQVLNKMNILTKDGSALNRFDIFDSDDKEQNGFKTTLKNTILVGSMFLPYVGGFFRGLSVLTQSVGLLGTLGKIATGSDSKLFNEMEGWSSSVNRQTAKSEYAQQNVWCLENMINLIGDSVAQLAEQRWIFEKGSQLVAGADIMSEAGQIKKQGELLENITKLNQQKIANLTKSTQDINKIAEASLALNKRAAQVAQDQLKGIINRSQKISGAISKAYMTGITVKDMYGEAKNAGASDTDAALLTIGYAAAEYALLSTGLGELVLPELRAGRYRAEAITNALFKNKNEALKSIADKYGSVATQAAKRAYVQKMIQFGKDIVSGVRVTGAKTAKATFAAALGEATEETSEEILADFMRSCHNISSWLQGDDDYMKSFGYDVSSGKFDIDDVVSRYGMSAIGGFIGGGIANMAINYKQIHQALSYTPQSAMQEIIRMTRNNELGDFMKYANKQILGNPNLSATEFEVINGQKVWKQGTKDDNQNLGAHKALNLQIEMIKNILAANGAKSNNEFLDINTMNDLRFMALHDSVTSGAYLQHYNQLYVDLVKATSELEVLENSKADTNNNGVVEDKEKRNARKEDENPTPSQENINKQIQEKREQVNKIQKEIKDLQDGKYAFKFIQQSLFEMTTAFSGNFTSPIFAIYAERKFNKKYDDLNDEEKQKALDEWKNFNNLDGSIRFQVLSDMYFDIAKNASDVIRSHGEKYLNEEEAFGKYENFLSNLFNYDAKDDEEWFSKLSQDLESNQVDKIGTQLHNIFFNDELFNLLKKIKEDFELTKPKFVDEANPTEEEKQQLKNWKLKMAEEMRSQFNEYLQKNLPKILDKYIDRKYATRTTKNALNKITLYAIDNLDNGDIFLDYLDEIVKLNRTPFEENLDSFAIAVGQKSIKLTNLVERVQKILDNNRFNLQNLQLSDNLYKELNNALKLISLYKAAIQGAQTDNAGLNNLFGFNATLNEVAKKLGDNTYKPLAEIDNNTAQILLQDIETNYQRLLTIKRIFLYNRGQKLQLQDRVAFKFNKIIFDKIRYIVSILDKKKFDSWEDLDKLKSIVTNSQLHQKANDENILTLTQEQEKEYISEQINIENALFDVFNKNIDKIQDFAEELDVFNTKEVLLTEETENISDREFFWFITGRTAVKSEQFYNLYKDVIDPDAEKPIAPLITQELGIYNQFANIVNCDIFSKMRQAFNNAVINKFKNLSEEDKKKVLGDGFYDIYSKSKNYSGDKFLGTLLSITKYDGFALVEGAAGTGKTKAIDTVTVKMLKKYSSESKDPLKHVAVVHGGSIKSAEDILASIDIQNGESFGKETFMKRMNPNWKELEYDESTHSFKVDKSQYKLNEQGLFVSTMEAKQDINPFSLIIIDEIQQFSTFDMDIIMDYARKHGISVITSGDFDQQGIEAYIPLEGAARYKVGLTAEEFIHSPKLGVIMRSDNQLKSINTIGFQAFMNNSELQKKTFEFNFYQDEKGLYGDKVINYKNDGIDEDIVKELDKLFTTLKEGEKVGFIYDNENSKLYQFLQTDKYKDKVDFKKGSSALGLESRYYIIETDSDNKQQYLKNIYTGITRSTQGSLLFIPMSTLKEGTDIMFVNKKSEELIQEPLPISQIRKYANKRKTILTEVIPNKEIPKFTPRTITTSNQSPTPPTKTKKVLNQGAILGLHIDNNQENPSGTINFTDEQLEGFFGDLFKQTKVANADIKSFNFVGEDNKTSKKGTTKVVYYDGDYYLITSKGVAIFDKDSETWTFAKSDETTIDEAINILKELNNPNGSFKHVVAINSSALYRNDFNSFNSEIIKFPSINYFDENRYNNLRILTSLTNTNYTEDELKDKFGDLLYIAGLFEYNDGEKNGKTPIVKYNGDIFLIDQNRPLIFKWDNNKKQWSLVIYDTIDQQALDKLRQLNEINSVNINDNAIIVDNLTDKSKQRFYGLLSNYDNTKPQYTEDDIIRLLNQTEPTEVEVVETGLSGGDVKETQKEIDTENDKRTVPVIEINNQDIDSLLFSFNTFELGRQIDDQGQILSDESSDQRIDGYNGLVKINKNITKNDAINLIKQLRESLMSISDKSALENELKVLLDSLFGDKCSPYVRFAFKFSAILSDGKNLATSNQKNLIFEKNRNERSLYNGNNQGARSGEVNRHTIVAIIGDRSNKNNIIEIPLLTLTSPFTLAQTTNVNGDFNFPEIANRINQLKKQNISIHEISKTIVKEFGDIARYKNLINLFKLFNIGDNTIVYLNFENNSYMPLLKRLGPQVSVKRGDYSLAEGFEFDSAEEANRRNVFDIVQNLPFYFTSTPITLIEDDDSLGIKKGSPIILFSDNYRYSSDDKIIQRFVQEQHDKTLPRHIGYFYIEPPKYSIKEYFKTKYNIITQNAYDKNVGNQLTTYNILKKIFENNETKEEFKKLVYDNRIFSFFETHVNNLNNKDNVKDQILYLNTIENGETKSILQRLDLELINLFHSKILGVTFEEKLNTLSDLCSEAGISEVYVHTVLRKDSKIGKFARIDSENYEVNERPFTTKIKLDQAVFSANVGGMVDFILNNIKQDKKTGKYYTIFDESYRNHDCDIKPGSSKPRVEINLDYIKNNLETIVSRNLSQEVINFMEKHYRETGEFISIIQSDKGKPILHIFQTNGNIKALVNSLYYYQPNNVNSYFTYEDINGNVYYVKIENGTVKEIKFNANTVKEYKKLTEEGKNGKIVTVDWEGMLQAEADKAFEYYNLTDQDIQEIYNTIHEDSGTDIQPRTNVQPENQLTFRQSLNILLNNEEIMKELEKKDIYKEDIDVESEEMFEQFMMYNMDAFSEVINQSNLDEQIKKRLTNIKGQCK